MSKSTPFLHSPQKLEKVCQNVNQITNLQDNKTNASANKRRTSMITSPHFKKQKNNANEGKKEHHYDNQDLDFLFDDFFAVDADFVIDNGLENSPSWALNKSVDIFSNIDIDGDKENNPKTSVSKLLNDSDFFPKDEDVSDLFKNKLLENAGNVGAVSKSTGWTQLQGTFDQTCVTQFQELGPFFGLPASVKALISKHKGIDDLYGGFTFS